jgi:hypothetical protein
VIALRSTINIRHPLAEGDERSRREARSEEARRLRREHARANRAWMEIGAADLVRRGPYLVDPDSGELFQRRRNVYANGTPNGPINEFGVSAFWVDDDGEPQFVGPPASGPKAIDDLTRTRAERQHPRARSTSKGRGRR